MADNLEEITCPACGKIMKKVFMPTQGVYLDVCLDGCGGIYFDNREFKKFNEANEDISPLIKAYENKVFNKVDTDKIRFCPVCSMKMVKHYSSSLKEVQVDDCYGCGGMFLDYNELERIRAEYKTELDGDLDAMKDLYFNVGNELRASQEKHVNLKENSFIRKYISKMVNTYNLNH